MHTPSVMLACDKLSITFGVHDEHKEAVLNGGFHYAKDKTQFVSYPSQRSIYKLNIGMTATNQQSGHQTVARLSLGPKKPDGKISFGRLEFNPSAWSYKDFLYLRGKLTSLLPDGWETVSSGRVTRVDVAADLHGVDIDSIYVMPKRVTRSRVYDRDGHIESIYLGTRGSKMFTRVYDKNIQKGQNNANLHVTRFEREIRTNMLVPKLLSLENPFASLIVGYLPAKSAFGNHPYAATFLLAAGKGGLVSAVGTLPKKDRPHFKKVLSSIGQHWLTAEQLWNQWNSQITSCGMFEP